MIDSVPSSNEGVQNRPEMLPRNLPQPFDKLMPVSPVERPFWSTPSLQPCLAQGINKIVGYRLFFI